MSNFFKFHRFIILILFTVNIYTVPISASASDESDIKILLSIKGGGMRGLIPAYILDHIEKGVGCKIATKVDMIGGTSTGAILALGAAYTGSPDTKEPRCSMEEIRGFYTSDGPNIFEYSILRDIASVGGLVDHQFDPEILHGVLRRNFGESIFSSEPGCPHASLCVPTVVTSFDTSKEEGITFESFHSERTMRITDVLMASTAAPIYFPCHVMLHNGKIFNMADGGLTSPNPCLEVLTKAKEMYGDDLSKFRLISIGTGNVTPESADLRPSMTGKLSCVGLTKQMMDASDRKANKLANVLLTNRDGIKRYWEFDPQLQERIDLADASPETLEGMRLIAEQFIRDNKSELDEVIELLRNHVKT